MNSFLVDCNDNEDLNLLYQLVALHEGYLLHGEHEHTLQDFDGVVYYPVLKFNTKSGYFAGRDHTKGGYPVLVEPSPSEFRNALRGEHPEVRETIDVGLTREEARTLRFVLNHIGGHPVETRRKYTDSINRKLDDLDVNVPDRMTDDGIDEALEQGFVVEYNNSQIYFKGTEEYDG